MHWILRNRWRDFIAGVSESSSEYDHSVDYEHEHRDAVHEHEEEPEQTIDKMLGRCERGVRSGDHVLKGKVPDLLKTAWPERKDRQITERRKA
jgi:hypothetical protein